jgi:hypothetical protein
VVAPDKALNNSLEQLKRIKDACGTNPVFILTPWPRFVKIPCCDEAGHVSNFAEPDFLQTILRDLTKMKFAIRKALQSATIVDSLELICGNSFSAEKADQVISAGWSLDPVHPTKHIYAKAALNLIEKIAAGNKQPSAAAQPGSRKRTWSTSNRSDQAGGTQGGDGPSGGHGKTDRSTSRSRQWPDVRRNGGGGG